MNIIFEISKAISPAIIAGLFTFLVAKYTYNRNTPLDNFNIAYNRVYYPLYRIILDKNNNEEDIIAKSKFYFDKYNKYIDKSTIRAYNNLCDCNNKTKRRNICLIYKDNINSKNSYLRKRLGYLEPNYFQLYKYSTASKRSEYRLLFEFYTMYILLFLGSFVINKIRPVYWFCICLITTLFFIFIIEIIICIVRTIYYKVRK